MTETKAPYLTAAPLTAQAQQNAAHADVPAPVSGFEPALVLLDVPAWPVGGEIQKLLLVTVREEVPGRDGIVVDATPVYRECVVRTLGELREALGSGSTGPK